jgi:hypothetical protein
VNRCANIQDREKDAPTVKGFQMRTLKLGKYRRARVWIGELPDTAYPAISVIKHSVQANGIAPKGLVLAAIEDCVPVTARGELYGLLGGTFEPDTTDALRVDVCASTANERLLLDNLSIKNDEVRVGLPAEYVQGVVSGVSLARAELKTLFAGKLTIHCAAHGAIGSCNSFYRYLTAILLKLINSPNHEPSDAELVKMFETPIN